MSLVQAPNPNAFITRLQNMLENSALLFPHTIGLNNSVPDLVNQIIQYELPIPQQAITGPELPHVFITASPNFINSQTALGKGTIDHQGATKYVLEFFIIVVTMGPDLMSAQESLYNICQAIETTLEQNKRMLDNTGNNAIAATSEHMVLPYLIDTDQRTIVSKNILFRPTVFVNMR